MRAQTIYAVVEHLTVKSKALGIRPQMIKSSIKGMSEQTGLHRDTIRSLFKNPEYGFIERNGQWAVGKEYKWEDIETVFKTLPDDVSKVIYWTRLPDFNWDEAGYQVILTVEERKILSQVRKKIAGGAKPENLTIGGSNAAVGLSKEEEELLEHWRKTAPVTKKALSELVTSAAKHSKGWETPPLEEQKTTLPIQLSEMIQECISEKDWNKLVKVALMNNTIRQALIMT